MCWQGQLFHEKKDVDLLAAFLYIPILASIINYSSNLLNIDSQMSKHLKTFKNTYLIYLGRL